MFAPMIAVKFELLATGEYYADLGTASEDRARADLRLLLTDVCHERFRRIDRFTQLALLGSGRCVQGLELPEQTGLYISSGFGSIANTVSVQQQIFIEHRVPKPLNFINTLSNSAGYYVARNLGLHARNQFVGRDAAPMEAALQLATLDLTLGNVEQALVGVVDEASAPLEEHARRLGVDTNVTLAEGSHWFLLRAAVNKQPALALDAVQTLHGIGELKDWFSGFETTTDACIWFAADVSAKIQAVCPALDYYAPDLGTYRSRTAGAVMHFLTCDDRHELVSVVVDDGRFHVMRFVRRP